MTDRLQPVDLSHPASVMQRMAEIENDLASRQNAYEDAAGRWFTAQREINRLKASALLTSDRPSVTEKRAEGELAAFDVEHASAEAEYEALKAAIKTMEQRAMILMSVLKGQGRG